MDSTYGLGYAKLAQVLLEQGRTLEALEAIGEAGSRGGDPFFIAAIRGDIYAEMERHTDAADAYDLALAFEPDDPLGAAPGGAGARVRGQQLARHGAVSRRHCSTSREGCHQTLIDYGDHLRRLGRIGDAVRLYRKAVARPFPEILSGSRRAARSGSVNFWQLLAEAATPHPSLCQNKNFMGHLDQTLRQQSVYIFQRSIPSLRTTLHIVVDKEGLGSSALAGAQGVLQPHPVPADHIGTSYKLPEARSRHDRTAPWSTSCR